MSAMDKLQTITLLLSNTAKSNAVRECLYLGYLVLYNIGTDKIPKEAVDTDRAFFSLLGESTVLCAVSYLASTGALPDNLLPAFRDKAVYDGLCRLSSKLCTPSDVSLHTRLSRLDTAATRLQLCGLLGDTAKELESQETQEPKLPEQETSQEQEFKEPQAQDTEASQEQEPEESQGEGQARAQIQEELSFDDENLEIDDTFEEQYKNLSNILAKTTPERRGLDDLSFDESQMRTIVSQSKIEDSIESVDDSCKDMGNDDTIDINDIEHSDDIYELLTAIMNRNEAVFKDCLELDRPYGMLYEKGMLRYEVRDGVLHYKAGVGAGTSIFEKLYTAIVRGAGIELNNAPDLRNVPNVKNIGSSAINYYPGFLFKYALGLVDDKRYTNWRSMSKALEHSIESRLKKLYKEGLFFTCLDRIEHSYSTALLVLTYEAGAGIKIRVSLPGRSIDTARLESSIRTITTYRNASIVISPLSGFEDVVDIQILQQEDKFLNIPYWAYKALKVKLDNGETPSLYEGLPIGRMVSGERIDFKLDPSSRFLTFIAAGSGAGKGVLTLSMVAAAIGSGVPVFYMDYKPDMAPIFWDISKKYGVDTFAYDAMVMSDGKTQAGDLPSCVEGLIGKHKNVFMYLRCVQLMCAMAQYRANNGFKQDIMFIFDETQALQKAVQNACSDVYKLNKEHKPKTVKGETQPEDDVYKVTSAIISWLKDVDANIHTYVDTTGRKSSTFCIFIAQSPDYSTWTGLKAKLGEDNIEMLSYITFANTICKILGKGATTSKYGLGGDGRKQISEKELKYVTNNRFFGIYDGKTTDGADIKIFKPFLTLNTDDLQDSCWTNGMGKLYGYGSVSDEQYYANVRLDHPAESGFESAYGTHSGTGLLGLTSMYCHGNTATLKSNLGSSWEYCLEFFNQTGLSARYTTPTDYMFDNSIDSFMLVSDMIAYDPSRANSVVYNIGDSASQQPESDSPSSVINTGIVVPDIQPATSMGTASTQGTQQPILDATFQQEAAALEAFESQSHGIQEQEPNAVHSEYGSVADVPEAVSEETIYNLLSSVPDGSDSLAFVSRKLQDDVSKGRLDPYIAESVARQLELREHGYINTYDYMGDTGAAQQDIRHLDQFVNPVIGSSVGASGFTGKNGRNVQIDTSETRNASYLTDDNSIDARLAGVPEEGFIGNLLLRTPSGAMRHINKLWRSILQAIINQGYAPSVITRVSLYGGQMYINGKIIILDGILGGRNGLRLKDIANFRILFSKFPLINEIRIDEEMLQVAIVEFDDTAIQYFFDMCKKLTHVYIKLGDGSTECCTRESISEKVSRASKRKDIENRLDIECQSLSSKGWNMKKIQENVWGMRLANRYMGKAGRNFKQRTRAGVGKTVLYGGAGLLVGAIGTVSYATYNGLRGLFGFGRRFSRKE